MYGAYVDEPLMMKAGGSKYYYASNHLYSVAALTDSTGAVVESYKYDAYGRQGIMNTNGTVSYCPSDYGNFVGFQGRYHDWETGLTYFRTRYEDPQLGRFLNRMPWFGLNGMVLSNYDLSNVDPGWIGIMNSALRNGQGSYIQGRYSLYDFEFQDPANSLESYSGGETAAGGVVGGIIGGPPGVVVGIIIVGAADVILAGRIVVAGVTSPYGGPVNSGVGIYDGVPGYPYNGSSSYYNPSSPSTTNYQGASFDPSSSGGNGGSSNDGGTCPPQDPNDQKQCKIRKPGLTGKEGAKDVPSWATGQRPYVGENGKQFATRLMNQKYGAGNWDKGADSEFSKIQKFGDRAFCNP